MCILQRTFFALLSRIRIHFEAWIYIYIAINNNSPYGQQFSPFLLAPCTRPRFIDGPIIFLTFISENGLRQPLIDTLFIFGTAAAHPAQSR